MDIVDVFLEFYQKDFFDQSHLDTYGLPKFEFNVLVIKMLEWLQLEYRREQWIKEGRNTSLKPITLKMEFRWCQNLEFLIKQEEIFAHYFSMKGNKCDFSDEITEEEKREMRKKAYEGFKLSPENVHR